MKKLLILLLFALIFPLAVFAQSYIRVSGKVIDAQTNEPLIGVTIIQAGTQVGTISDLDGFYTINVPTTASLVYSYIGYISQTISVDNQPTIFCHLLPDEKELDEVLVVGYGTQKKSDVTGSVASVVYDDIKRLSANNAASALQGKAAGIQVLNYSGAPGSSSEIRVRGYSSNSGEIGPLLIVDGLKVDNIQYLDPSIIASIEVLKDAASAAIYGAEAGNGVILITTKTGGEGTASINYSYKYTSQSLSKHLDLLDREQYIDYKRQIGVPIDNYLETYDDGVTDTYWPDVVFENGISKQHSIVFQAGSKKGHFLFGLNYLTDDGIIVGHKDTYERFTAQINSDYLIKEWLTLGTNNTIEKYSSKMVSQMQERGSVMLAIYQCDPLTPLYYDSYDDFIWGAAEKFKQNPSLAVRDETGQMLAISKLADNDHGNPLLQLSILDSKNNSFSLRGTTYANFSPFRSLVFTSRVGYRFSHSVEHSYSAPYYASEQCYSSDGLMRDITNTGFYYQWENFINFNKKLSRNILGIMGGMSFIYENNDNLNGSASGPDILICYEDNFKYLDFLSSNSSTKRSVSNLPTKSASIAYYGRMTYSYDNKYSFQANFRADAFDKSKLPIDKCWGIFPSFSVGWTISNENFIKNNIPSDILSFLKFRVSWGQNGNINVLKNYAYSPTISYNSKRYQYSVSPNSGFSYGSEPSKYANPDLTWETSEQLDFGLDFRFFKNKLILGVDYYNKSTKDLLVDLTPVAEIGVKNVTVNGGKIENKGFELELIWKDKISRDFNYNVKANLATLSNKVTYIDPQVGALIESPGYYVSEFRNCFEVGHPVWYFRGYKLDHIDYETGTPIIADLNNDNIINGDDKTDIGSSIPKLTYGLTINVDYRGFDFTIFGTGVYGNKICPIYYRTDRLGINTLAYYYENSWSENNKNAKFPKPTKENAENKMFWASDANIFDGSYFKFKNIQLGYTLPYSISHRFFVENMRFYVSLDDYFTISSYPGLDPETATTSFYNQMGVDMGTYPSSKKVIFGINVTF